MKGFRIGFKMYANLLVCLAACLCLAASAAAAIDATQYDVIYFDDFTTDTLAEYTYGGNAPLNRVSYSSQEEALKIILGDNVNFFMYKDIPVTVNEGYMEIRFYPWQVYPFDGITRINVYDANNNFYRWHFSRDSNKSWIGNWQQYRARAQKHVNGSNNIYDIFVPSPVDSYSLNEWHTMGMKFSPTGMTVYVDGVEIATYEDPAQAPINATRVGVDFMQQSQYLGHIKLMGVKDVIDADIDIDPDTLNLKSNGRVITCYIELPTNDVSLVDLATVRLADGPLAEISPSDVGDYDEDGYADIMVKFDRADVIDYILQSGAEDRQEVELVVVGKISDGTKFEGSDIIRVLKKEFGKK